VDAAAEARARDQAEDVARSAAAIVQRHDGRLVALTIGVPEWLEADGARRLVEQRLVSHGIDFVDIVIVRSAGPMRVICADFER
jgi:hypothetical protein